MFPVAPAPVRMLHMHSNAGAGAFGSCSSLDILALVSSGYVLVNTIKTDIELKRHLRLLPFAPCNLSVMEFSLVWS